MQRKKRIGEGLIKDILSVFSLVLVILATVHFGLKQPITLHTFSNIGSDEAYRSDFIVWGILTSLIFVLYLRKIYKFALFENSFAFTCLSFSGASLFLTVLTPSNTILYPLLGRLHVVFSIAFSALIILSVSIFLNYLTKNDISRQRPPRWWMPVVIFGSVSTMAIFGWCGVFELFFFISFAAMLFVLDLFVHKNIDETTKKSEIEKQTLE